jgi:glycerophosphoryl diester phosphodiesterase
MVLEDPAGRPRGEPRRRAVLVGGVAIAGLVAAGVTVGVLRSGRIAAPAASAHGRLVDQLLSTPRFSVAHRGGDLDWPEMSLFAYQKSVARGVNALELSLARTSDGVWFGLHDATLDRTSGTKGFIAAEHTWAEVDSHRITSSHTGDRTQPSRPYLRLETLAKAYGATHTIFIDPKAAGHQYYPELFTLLDTLVAHPTKTFVAKGYYPSAQWSNAARDRGYQRWGYFFASDLARDPNAMAKSEGLWSILGLEYTASAADWKTMLSFGKPVIGHVIPTKIDAEKAIALGASGLMISGVTQVLGQR